MMKFYCSECNKDFEEEKPVKKEYRDYLLGPCSKNIAYCPSCGNESAEKLVPKPLKIQPQKYSCDGNCQCCSEA